VLHLCKKLPVAATRVIIDHPEHMLEYAVFVCTYVVVVPAVNPRGDVLPTSGESCWMVLEFSFIR
jgi:hypothetical protein